MSTTNDPNYQKGYRAGRRKTEREVADTIRLNSQAEGWNRIYTSLLPVAMQVTGWTIGAKPVSSTEDRIDLARRWADTAVRNLK